MNTKQFSRVAVGTCAAAALLVGTGLVCAPAAEAATPGGQTASPFDLLGTVGDAVGSTTSTVTGLLGSPTPDPGATTAPTTGGVTADVTSGDTSVVTVQLGGTAQSSTGTQGSTGTDGTPAPSGSSTTPSSTPTSSSTSNTSTSSTSSSTASGMDTSTAGAPTPASGGTPSAPATLSALSVTAQYATVFPVRDGYRDTVAFALDGVTSDGAQHVVGGTATLMLGSRVVADWPVASTDQRIVWNGMQGASLVPGRYVLTVTVGDAGGARIAATAAVDVSSARLMGTTARYASKAVSGWHRMAAKPRAAMAKGAVTLRITAVASHVKGRQYLVFTHGGKRIKVLIRNGKHTSKAVTIPKGFTSYTISHTWKKGTVRISSLLYRYAFRTLK
ncbi:hypothetical protein [Amnibacterium sp.]|uniref:hypothetical protein n=1 Tax=Amnibacterium sp. TaxID=1872496 RepID=UPI003F7C0B65